MKHAVTFRAGKIAVDSSEVEPAAQQIDDIIKKHGGWKGEILSQVRAAVLAADPNIVEEVKWKTPTRPEGLPVWTYDGIVCMAEAWKDNIKLIFVKGAQLEGLQGHFNARLKSSTDRAIEFREGDSVDAAAIKTLVQPAAELNEAKKRKS